jgi:hypothetical protein
MTEDPLTVLRAAHIKGWHEFPAEHFSTTEATP